MKDAKTLVILYLKDLIKGWKLIQKTPKTGGENDYSAYKFVEGLNVAIKDAENLIKELETK